MVSDLHIICSLGKWFYLMIYLFFLLPMKKTFVERTRDNKRIENSSDRIIFFHLFLEWQNSSDPSSWIGAKRRRHLISQVGACPGPKSE